MLAIACLEIVDFLAITCFAIKDGTQITFEWHTMTANTWNQEPVNCILFDWLEDFNLCLHSDRKFCKIVKSIFMTCKAKLEMK